jgi:hypothetical protein
MLSRLSFGRPGLECTSRVGRALRTPAPVALPLYLAPSLESSLSPHAEAGPRPLHAHLSVRSHLSPSLELAACQHAGSSVHTRSTRPLGLHAIRRSPPHPHMACTHAHVHRPASGHAQSRTVHTPALPSHVRTRVRWFRALRHTMGFLCPRSSNILAVVCGHCARVLPQRETKHPTTIRFMTPIT